MRSAEPVPPASLFRLFAGGSRSVSGSQTRTVFDQGLAELHTHLGSGYDGHPLSLAHEQGIAPPVKDYWEFDRLVTVSDPRGVPSLDALDQIYHWTELIQPSPLAVERSVHAAIGGAYRSQGITTLELRLQPDEAGTEAASATSTTSSSLPSGGLTAPRSSIPQVRAGLILMMDRTFDARLNEIVVEKAIRWAPARDRRGRHRRPAPGRRPLRLHAGRADGRDRAPAGLGVTIHVGEEGGDVGREEIGEVVEALRPDRIGHGPWPRATPS